MSGDKKFERIPHDIVPVNYNITFHCDLKNFVFNGYLVLDVNVKESTETLQLNVKEVQLSDVTCGSIKGTPSINAEKELVVIKFDSPLPKGDAKISLNFKGIHNDVMMGFYRSKYNLPNGKEVFNLSTQFESTFARRAFPCIDEPDRKATFEITLVVPDNLVAISNMPEISRKKLEKPANLPNLEDGAGYVEVKFDKTPIMSTYLLAMVVGHFEFIEDKDSNGIPIRVYTPIGKKHCGEFAMDVTKKCLPFYTNCFGVGYPLPKIDLIAIPDFAAGAMENWGLVTYRETALLVDPAQSSRALLQRVAIVVAHELAHMWFGNLVTMKWWTHLWLNEGFATWMEYHATDSVLPEFDLWTQFACDEQSTAFSLDGLKSSHPIEVEVKNPDEVDEIFDMISYAKGASVIKMLFSYIGKDKFFAGLKDYINKFKYSNTETFDLWNAFSASSGEKINELMDSWTQKMGYPIVEITRNGDDLKFSQSRYLSDGSKEEEPKSHWTIPLKICKADNNEVIIETIKMPNDGSEVKVKCTEKNIRVNPNRSSFVRIQYDDATLKSIMEVVKDKKLKPVDRLALIDDKFMLAFAGHGKIVDAIDMSKAFKGETSHVVWSSISSNIGHIRKLMEEYVFDKEKSVKDKIEENLNKIIIALAEPIYKRLGWKAAETDNHCDKLLRSQVIGALGKCGHKELIEEANKMFNKHYEAFLKYSADPKTSTCELIDPDLRSTVYGIVNRNSGPETFDKLVELYKCAKMQDEKVRLLGSLGLSPLGEVREKCMNFTFTDAVRKQDRHCSLLSVAASGAQGRRQLWTFVQSKIATLKDDLGSTHLLGHILKGSIRSFASQQNYDFALGFFKKNPVPCERTIQQGCEEILNNMSQLKRDGDLLVKYLSN